MNDRDALAAMLPMGGPGYEEDQDKLFGLVLPLLINGCAGELVQPFIDSRDYLGMRKALCTQYLSSEAITTLIARLHSDMPPLSRSLAWYRLRLSGYVGDQSTGLASRWRQVARL